MKILQRGGVSILAGSSIGQAKGHGMQGKERGRAKMFWTGQPFRRLEHEVLYQSCVNGEMGVVVAEKVRHAA
jgi:hypothetical protein